MEVFGQSMFLFFVLGLGFAVIEIESEGKYGWGQKFPTWYRETGKLAWMWKRFNDKPLTGYHLPLTLLTIGIFLWPMFDRHDFTLAGALRAMSQYFAWVVVWDFSWFVLNPHYGLRHFRRDRIWWFAREPWILNRIPLSYVVAWGMSLACAAARGWIMHQPQYEVTVRLHQMGWYLVCLAFTAFVLTPVYHTYYRRMRRRDDRSLAGIFPSGKDATSHEVLETSKGWIERPVSPR